MKTVEDHRTFWASVARKHGWYVEPFYVQVFQNEAGEIWDSVSSQGMTRDYIVIEEEFDEDDD